MLESNKNFIEPLVLSLLIKKYEANAESIKVAVAVGYWAKDRIEAMTTDILAIFEALKFGRINAKKTKNSLS
jgi:hypothetical protein